MFALNDALVPWKDKARNSEILQSKSEFMRLHANEVPTIFLGLRQMIKRAAELDFYALPDYNAFREDICNMFAPMH